MKVEIAVTFWNRFPERLECLKRTYEAIESNMDFGKYEHEWLISSELDRCVDKEKVLDFFSSKPNVRSVWKVTPASLSSNLNTVLSLCVEPLILYLQDDWVLTEPLSIEADADFLLNSDFDLIRYKYVKRDPKQLTLVNSDLKLYEISHDAKNLYSDHPHLKKFSFHQKYGYFPESTDRGYDSGYCELYFNRSIRDSDAKILFRETGNDEMFEHISDHVSTLKEKWEGWHRRQAEKKNEQA